MISRQPNVEPLLLDFVQQRRVVHVNFEGVEFGAVVVSVVPDRLNLHCGELVKAVLLPVILEDPLDLRRRNFGRAFSLLALFFRWRPSVATTACTRAPFRSYGDQNAILEVITAISDGGNKCSLVLHIEFVRQIDGHIGNAVAESGADARGILLCAFFIDPSQQELAPFDSAGKVVVARVCFKGQSHTVVYRAAALVQFAVVDSFDFEECWIDFPFEPCLSGYHPHPLYVVCTHFPE